MGEATRRKNAPEPDQPIPAEKIRELYPEMLELELMSTRLQLEQVKLTQRAQAFNQRVTIVAEGVNLAEWRLDYKSGKMVRLIPAKAEGA